MIEHLLIHLGQYLFGLSEEKRREAHDRIIARNQHKRRLVHADIPALEVVQQTHGHRFDALLTMMFESDPARLHTRRSRRARDWKHAALVQRRYRMLTWSLIHRLVNADSAADIKRIFELELSLWFDVQLGKRDLEAPDGLLQRLVNWRRRWDFT